MPKTFPTLSDLYAHGADTVIDVRSPAEFAEDHIPGAVNLPALSNDERAEVGTIYVQDSAFRARKIGATMVARNVAAHLEGPLADKPGGWQPLVYCWRGGQRSGSFASILSQIGWRAETIAGGYQSYRRLVADMLHHQALPHQGLILLDGNTGTGKTAILERLRARNIQVVDLEALARHRGSLLGAIAGPQPAQKAFESALAQALTACNPTLPVVVEAESSKIGQINLPPSLWSAMISAPRIMVSAPIAARAAFLAESYHAMAQDSDWIKARLAPLRRLRGHAVVDRWEGLLDAGELPEFAAALVTDHYDPAYAKARTAQSCDVIGAVAASSLDDAGLNDVAHRVAQIVTDAG